MLPPSIIESFNRVADVLPHADWLDLSIYWLERNLQEGLPTTLPRIVVDDATAQRLTALAAYIERHDCIVFSSEAAAWDEAPLDALMAHELAHVFHLATGIILQSEPEEEAQAIRTMKRWGYDDQLIEIYHLKMRYFKDASAGIEHVIRESLKNSPR